MLTGFQIRAARGCLSLHLKDISSRIGIHHSTLTRLESQTANLTYINSNTRTSLLLKNFYQRLWQKDLSSPHLSYFNKSNLEKLLIKYNYELIHSDSLDSIGKESNFQRLNSTIKNKFICFFLSSVLFFLYYLQKILPKDIIYQIYKITNLKS